MQAAALPTADDFEELFGRAAGSAKKPTASGPCPGAELLACCPAVAAAFGSLDIHLLVPHKNNPNPW